MTFMVVWFFDRFKVDTVIQFYFQFRTQALVGLNWLINDTSFFENDK